MDSSRLRVPLLRHALLLAASALCACGSSDKGASDTQAAAEADGEGEAGGDGAAGADGSEGAEGDDGSDGTDGEDGSDGTDGEDGSDGTDDPPEAVCAPLPAPDGPVIDVTPEDVPSLRSIISGAAAGTTIRFAAGTYALNGEYLWVDVEGLTLRSADGDPERVVLDGNYTTTQLISVKASNVTIADLTIRRAYTHAIHVNPGESSIENTLIHNVIVEDPGQQGIKINQSGTAYADHGTVRCSTIRLTEAGRPNIRDNCYTGGIDAHRTQGWHVHDNHISGFWCEEGLSEHGIHFWQYNAGTLIERNTIENCARGIGLGLLGSESSTPRSFEDLSCDGGGAFVEDWDGTVRNNTVLADDAALFASETGFDTGIALASACGAKVLHNTVYSTAAPFSSIEWRFAGSDGALVGNNLVSHPMKARDATATEAGNLTEATAADFVDAAGHDLGLASSSPAVDAGADLGEDAVSDDRDGNLRDDGAPDVGALER